LFNRELSSKIFKLVTYAPGCTTWPRLLSNVGLYKINQYEKVVVQAPMMPGPMMGFDN